MDFYRGYLMLSTGAVIGAERNKEGSFSPVESGVEVWASVDNGHVLKVDMSFNKNSQRFIRTVELIFPGDYGDRFYFFTAMPECKPFKELLKSTIKDQEEPKKKKVIRRIKK